MLGSNSSLNRRQSWARKRKFPAEFKGRREDKELFDEATVWIGALVQDIAIGGRLLEQPLAGSAKPENVRAWLLDLTSIDRARLYPGDQSLHAELSCTTHSPDLITE